VATGNYAYKKVSNLLTTVDFRRKGNWLLKKTATNKPVCVIVRQNWTCELSGHWCLFVLVSCAGLSWSHPAFESTLNSCIVAIVSYRIVENQNKRVTCRSKRRIRLQLVSDYIKYLSTNNNNNKNANWYISRIVWLTHVMSGPLGWSNGWGVGSIRPTSIRPFAARTNPYNVSVYNNITQTSMPKLIALTIRQWSFDNAVFGLWLWPTNRSHYQAVITQISQNLANHLQHRLRVSNIQNTSAIPFYATVATWVQR